jgi:hypothetical protein
MGYMDITEIEQVLGVYFPYSSILRTLLIV